MRLNAGTLRGCDHKCLREADERKPRQVPAARKARDERTTRAGIDPCAQSRIRNVEVSRGLMNGEDRPRGPRVVFGKVIPLLGRDRHRAPPSRLYRESLYISRFPSTMDRASRVRAASSYPFASRAL